MPATSQSSYSPYGPARRPGGKPAAEPHFRVLVHRKCEQHWAELADRVGLSGAQRTWDHLAMQPDQPPPIGQCTKMRGMNKYERDGWSAIYHYEVSSMVRLDYQFHRNFRTSKEKEPSPVVRIPRIDFSSH